MLRRCVGCRRHVNGNADACPFCGAALPSIAAPPRLSIALGLGLAACGGSTSGDDGSSTSADSSGSAESTSGASMSSTTVATSSSETTTASTGVDGTGAESSESTSVGDGSAGFYGVSPDVGGPPTCDVLVQDCPIGDKCTPYTVNGTTWDALKCVPVAPDPNAVGDPCTVEGSAMTGIDDCDVGLLCWDVDTQTNMGTCVALCTGAWPDPICEDAELQCTVIEPGVLAVCGP